MQALYTVVYAVGFIALSPLFLYKMWKRGKYRENFWQRFGRYSAADRAALATKTKPRCWIQAVSVGEVNLALLLIPAIQKRFPDTTVVLTTTTSTGYALARERLPAPTPLLYFPQDFPPCVCRAYDLIQPDFIVLIESELWPQHLWTATRRGVPVFLVNARMSPRSARRYRRARAVFRHVAGRLTLVGAQSPDDAANFLAAGVAPDRVILTGNMKYDAALPQARARVCDPRAVLTALGVASDQPVWVAGSTHPGEEELVCRVFTELRRQFPRLLLVLAPRHVERTAEVTATVARHQLRHALRTDTRSAPPPADGLDCLILNTTGELRWFYEVATVVFVGKSLVGTGGQNIVEPAALGRPVVFGPHMQNFQAISREFVAAGAGAQVADAAALRATLAALLADPARRQTMVDAAHRVIQANLGATARTIELIARHRARHRARP